jgi:hypothetical protein
MNHVVVDHGRAFFDDVSGNDADPAIGGIDAIAGLRRRPVLNTTVGNDTFQCWT